MKNLFLWFFSNSWSTKHVGFRCPSLIWKLRENLIPSDDKEKKDVDTKRVHRWGIWPNPVLGSHWCYIVVAKYQLTCFRQHTKVASQWASLFDEKQCKVLNSFLCTLSEFGHHNMRGLGTKKSSWLSREVIQVLPKKLDFPWAILRWLMTIQVTGLLHGATRDLWLTSSC